jgi:hypothetical protein
MKIDYDSEGHSLLIEFGEFRYFEKSHHIEYPGGDSCIAWVDGDHPYAIQLLGADRDITPLDAAAERFGLDAEALRTAARAALAAPDREVQLAA